MKRFHLKLYKKFKSYSRVVEVLKRVVIPGFGGVPLFYIISFFINGIINESVSTRASAIAFNFFLALFPALIFVFTLIPYMPLDELHEEIIDFFRQVLPENAFLTIVSVLEDILSTRRGGLLSFGLFLALFFATNGLHSLMEAFNKHDKRSYWHKRVIAAGLTVAYSFILIIGFSLTIFGRHMIELVFDFNHQITLWLLEMLRWILVYVFVFGSVLMLYFYSSFPRRPVQLYVSGALLAAFLLIISSLAFAFYVENYAYYHKFYGTLGTIIVLMLWFYFQSIVLIIGYELNHSILMARNSLKNFESISKEQKDTSKLF